MPCERSGEEQKKALATKEETMPFDKVSKLFRKLCQSSVLETNLNVLCLVFFFFFFGDFGMGFTVVCVFGFEFLAGFRSRCCRR